MLIVQHISGRFIHESHDVLRNSVIAQYLRVWGATLTCCETHRMLHLDATLQIRASYSSK